MAYVEVTYYRDCALELREYGDTGWAVHIYAPRFEAHSPKIGVLMTTRAAGLRSLMDDARGVVDAQLTHRDGAASQPPHRASMPQSSGYSLSL